MAQRKGSIVGLDTSILLMLELGEQTAIRAIELLHQSKCQLLVTSWTLIELQSMAEKSPSGPRKLATDTLKNLKTWVLVPTLSDAQHEIVDQVASSISEHFRNTALLRGDAQIIAECAVLGAAILLTENKRLQSLDGKKARQFLKDHDLPSLSVLSARDVVKASSRFQP
jgi:predicted nucleic acid-binding protein